MTRGSKVYDVLRNAVFGLVKDIGASHSLPRLRICNLAASDHPGLFQSFLSNVNVIVQSRRFSKFIKEYSINSLRVSFGLVFLFQFNCCVAVHHHRPSS